MARPADIPWGFDLHLSLGGVILGGFKEVGFREATPQDFASCHAPAGTPLLGIVVLQRGYLHTPESRQWFEAPNPSSLHGVIQQVQKSDGRPLFEWTFEKGWPCRYEGPRVDAGKNQIAIETVEIAHEGLKFR